MKLYSRNVFFSFLFFFTLVNAKRPPNPYFYTGYSCNATTECPEDAGFCNEEQQCECSIGQKPQKGCDKTTCETFDCGTDSTCQYYYGNNAGCIVTEFRRRCSCIGQLYWSQTDRECSIDRQKIGENCTNDDNCTIWAVGPGDSWGGNYDGSFCDEATSKCTCKLGQKPHGDWFCKTMTCTYPDERACQETNPKLECVRSYDGKIRFCQCQKGYEPDRHYYPSDCVIPVPGKSCNNLNPCNPGLKCVGGKCQRNSSNFLSFSVSIFVVFALIANYLS